MANAKKTFENCHLKARSPFDLQIDKGRAVQFYSKGASSEQSPWEAYLQTYHAVASVAGSATGFLCGVQLGTPSWRTTLWEMRVGGKSADCVNVPDWQK